MLYKLSITNMRHLLPHIDGESINGNTFFEHSDIERATTLNPFSHVYMFDVGFPQELHCSIARKFNQSLYASHLVSFKAPQRIIGQFGFNVQIMRQLPTSMHGEINII